MIADNFSLDENNILIFISIDTTLQTLASQINIELHNMYLIIYMQVLLSGCIRQHIITNLRFFDTNIVEIQLS